MALLIGDSFFARMLDLYPHDYHPLSKYLCVRGARVQEIKHLVKSTPALPTDAVMLLGVNNLLSPHDLTSVWQDYVSLVRHLIRRGVNLYYCKIIPIANSQRRVVYQSDVNKFNFFISNFKCESNVTILSFDSVFLSGNSISTNLFCPWIRNRPDFIHPNSKGLSLMHQLIQTSVV